MKEFTVAYSVSGTVYFSVEANSIEEAKDKADGLDWDIADNLDLDVYDVSVEEY